MTKIRFATYNVCAEHCPKLRAWSYRVSRVTAVIKSKNPDVVTLQETGGYTRLTSLTSRMKSSGYTRVRGGSSRWIFYRTATMSARDYKGAALYGKTVHVQYGSNGKRQAIPIQLLRQTSTNARVLVVNFHLQALDFTTKDQARLSEFRQVSNSIASFRKTYPTIPVVKAGDFNSLLHGNTRYDSDSARWRVYNQIKSDGYKDARTSARSTSNASASSLNKMSDDRRRFPPSFQLDHIFVQRNAIVTAWGLLTRNVSYGSQYSDHDMIWADVSLRSR
ncbi:MAG: endonuclease/exonuclease/phosphatase family protein [Flavobacterium sp.]|nr:endonuclease/exonuclease/phosphatase family protein [Aeromicrobium sp.]